MTLPDVFGAERREEAIVTFALRGRRGVVEELRQLAAIHYRRGALYKTKQEVIYLNNREELPCGDTVTVAIVEYVEGVTEASNKAVKGESERDGLQRDGACEVERDREGCLGFEQVPLEKLVLARIRDVQVIDREVRRGRFQLKGEEVGKVTHDNRIEDLNDNVENRPSTDCHMVYTWPSIMSDQAESEGPEWLKDSILKTMSVVLSSLSMAIR